MIRAQMIGMGYTSLPNDYNPQGWPSQTTHVRIWDIGVTWANIHGGVDRYDWTRLDQAYLNTVFSSSCPSC